MDSDKLTELERRLTQWERDTGAASYPIDCDELRALITAARRPALPDREAVAKLIDPEAFVRGTYVYEMQGIRRPDALTKADAILALFALSPAPILNDNNTGPTSGSLVASDGPGVGALSAAPKEGE